MSSAKSQARLGMDIVRQSAQSSRLDHRRIDARRALAFTIRLPMTLAIVRALGSVGNQTFAIPMQAVTQIVRVEKSKASRASPRIGAAAGQSHGPAVSARSGLESAGGARPKREPAGASSWPPATATLRCWSIASSPVARSW